MAYQSGPEWLRQMPEEKRSTLEQRAQAAGLDLVEQAWACDEWWEAKKSKKQAKWYSRLLNWLLIASRPRTRPMSTDEAQRSFQPSAGPVRQRAAVTRV